ncbi:restriction endonuclease subunit S [Thalassospira alkalitolerans]|uniref:restriction endonuclease subunit S n=1 Tax=Thalassospira alkalitolerans TaxID=1293890 RepID=UPI003AA83A3B
MPEERRTERLGDICYIKARIGWRGLSSSEYTEDGPYLIAGQHIRGGQITWDQCDHITEQRYLESHEIILRDGDVIITKDGTIGRVARIDDLPGDATINGTMMLVRPLRRLNYRYLYHILNGRGFQKLIDDKVSGSSIPHLFQRDMVELKVELPSPDHQSKIAEILDTLDAAIRGTEAVVAKLKAMKQGLLHDLLTRGIDANGDLRPPHTEAPHLYKETPLGWLPKEWDVREIQSLLAPVDPAMRSGPFGSALLKEELVSEGIPFLGIDNVFVERFDRNYKRFVTQEKFLQLRRYAVRPDDLMITIMGTVGRCCLVPEDVGEALSSKHTWTISLDQSKYSPYLAMLQVNYSDWVLRHFSKDQQGGTMSAIRSETIRSTMLPVPPRGEQDGIEAILAELSTRLREEQTMLDKLRLEKSGLMDDLLTGRTPVTALL